MRFASTHSATTSSSDAAAWSPMDGRPAPQGMYDPRNEHDACGVGFVATLTGEASHDAGRAGADRPAQPRAPRCHRLRARLRRRRGILLQVPDAFLREVVDFELPEAGAYAVGIAFLPADGRARRGRRRASRRSPPRRA